MSPLERQAVREILAEVRQEMDAIFGHSQASSSMDEGRLVDLVHEVAARWLRARANANLPLLPFVSGPPARPIEVVRAVYQFAAEHPEVASYVPCYCGCERAGHHGSEDCFVASRGANGDVESWEPHGMT